MHGLRDNTNYRDYRLSWDLFALSYRIVSRASIPNCYLIVSYRVPVEKMCYRIVSYRIAEQGKHTHILSYRIVCHLLSYIIVSYRIGAPPKTPIIVHYRYILLGLLGRGLKFGSSACKSEAASPAQPSQPGPCSRLGLRLVAS